MLLIFSPAGPSGGASGHREAMLAFVLNAMCEKVEEMRYLVIIETDGKGCPAYVPDLPGCVAAGDTKDEVRELICEGIQLHLNGMRETGDLMPEPKSTAEYVETAP